MKSKSNVLAALMIMLTVILCSPVQAQQKKITQHADFSGEWESKESISMGGNIVCTYNSGDRMLAETMKITDHGNFLTIDANGAFPGEPPVKRQEKLTFDGKASQINHGQGRGKKFAVKWSADGQTMTVNSTVFLKYPHQKQQIIYVTEVWKLINDGKSITVHTNAKSSMFDKGRSWKTVFDKAAWYSKIFS